jgi:hypothetical protein
MFKKLFLGLLKFLSQSLLFALKIFPLLVGMKAAFTRLATAGASRTLPAVGVRAHDTGLPTNEAIITRRGGRGTRLFNPVGQTIVVSVLVAFGLDHGTTRHTGPWERGGEENENTEKTCTYLRGHQRLNPLGTKDREGGDDVTDLKEARGPQLFE